MKLSLLDNDFYVYTMMSTILHHFPSTEVEYKLIVRTKDADLRPLRANIQKELDALCEIQHTKEEVEWLRSIRFFKKDFVDYLEDYRLKSRYVNIYEQDDQLQIRIKGPWLKTIPFGVNLLSIIEEQWCKQQAFEVNMLTESRVRLAKKLEYFHQSDRPFNFYEFGTRRRCSSEWQDELVGILKEKEPAHFMGTSNMYLAKKHGVNVSGTMGHEYISAGMGMPNVQLKHSQQFMLEKWILEYRGDLGYCLTDTITTTSFLRDLDLYLAKLFDGFRPDSGNPYEKGEEIITRLKELHIDPKTKYVMFSDNLNFQKATDLANHFRNRIQPRISIGTNFTNDCGVDPLSIVIKMIKVNGQPCAKISDEPGKEICEDPQFMSYLKKVYNVEERGNHV